MIKAIVGVPGAGKGVYGTMQAEEELRNTDRPIITCLALRVAPWTRRLTKRRSRREIGMAAYLLDKYGDDLDVWSRVHVLTDEEFREFYLWRVNEAGELFKVDAVRDSAGKVITFDIEQFAKSRPCCYMMDEAWKFIWSRAWQDSSKGFMFYIAQHRHAGDDLWVIGQSESQFDKAVRDLVQDWHSLVNHRYRKFWFFKQPNVISVVISNESPKQRKSIAAAPKLIRFDPKGIGACFDTSAGMGQSGQGADIEAKTKGLPSWLLPLAVVGLGVLIIAWARGAGWLTGKLLTGGRKTPYAAAKSVRSPGLVESMMASVHPSSGATNSAEPVFLRGWARLGKDFVFFLSDDTTVRSSDTNVARFGDFGLEYAGRRIPFAKPPPAAPVVPVVPAVPVVSDPQTTVSLPGEVAGSPTARRPVRIISQGLRVGPDGAWHPSPTVVIEP